MVLKEGITIKDKLRDLDKVNIESRICYLKEK